MLSVDFFFKIIVAKILFQEYQNGAEQLGSKTPVDTSGFQKNVCLKCRIPGHCCRGLVDCKWVELSYCDIT